MSLTVAIDNEFLKLELSAAAVAVLSASAGATAFIALHTADPGAGGTQSTNEAAFAGYARVALPRTCGGWTLSANSPSNAAIAAAVAAGTVTFFSIGSALTGPGTIAFRGAIGVALRAAVAKATA